MAAQGNVTLNTKVYTPRGKRGDVAKWTLAGDSTFGGAQSDITESVRGPTKLGVSRVLFKLDVPKAATTDSACGCAGTEIARAIAALDITVPSNFTAAERLDFSLRIQGLVANAIFGDAVSYLEGAW
jgi:hypothetical protein